MSCIIPYQGLKRIALRRFSDNCSTMDLMATAASNQERALVAIVALMSVENDQRYRGISGNELEFMLQCHRYVESVLAEPTAEQLPLVAEIG
jgi:hypothetical protein